MSKKLPLTCPCALKKAPQRAMRVRKAIVNTPAVRLNLNKRNVPCLLAKHAATRSARPTSARFMLTAGGAEQTRANCAHFIAKVKKTAELAPALPVSAPKPCGAMLISMCGVDIYASPIDVAESGYYDGVWIRVEHVVEPQVVVSEIARFGTVKLQQVHEGAMISRVLLIFVSRF